ncbi:hypothetical protein EB796_010715 [Bugula neritina]|uniref:rRNA-processing protein FYV7 n=1 Tax=Bugula neritina TaxID=10212 RepID=A0A7J7JX41_BUGNE|nr:hypothetical protein EB796_010715 [Bugula neritina]
MYCCIAVMGKPGNSKGIGAQKYGRSNDGSGFTNIRKKKAINSYKKILRREKRDDDLHQVIKMQKRKKQGIKQDTYKKVHVEIETKRQKAEEDRIKRQQEREERLKQIEESKAVAAEKRKQRQKLFSKKTRKGQPYLDNQITLLLDKIEKSVNKKSKNN